MRSYITVMRTRKEIQRAIKALNFSVKTVTKDREVNEVGRAVVRTLEWTLGESGGGFSEMIDEIIEVKKRARK